jgi:class 3 adenylate cyclase
MDRKTQSGYLVLADISGFTSFVAETELEHADVVISHLLESIVEKLSSRLTISKLEGDAVFAYIEESKLLEDTTLLELIDHTYLAFRDQAETLSRQTACPCKACRAIPMLDLKFMVHFGDFVIQNVAGIKDLLGTDVNLIHRLMKNHVADSKGWNSYALFTRQGLERMQTDKESFVQQTETYEHLGDIETYITDMHVRYEKMRAS